MNNKIAVSIFLFVILLSCKNEVSIALTSENFSEEYKGTCQEENCAKVTIDFVKINGVKEVADKINFTIGSAMIYFLNTDTQKDIKVATVAEAANLFINGYENDKKQFPDLGPYEAELSVSTSLISSKIISIKTQFYNYTGGAHGNTQLGFLNFDPITGNVKTLNSLIKNKKEFTDFVETIFREKYHISKDESINSTGFWFDKEKFRLSEIIGFSENKVIIIYNQYDIASYADGPIEIEIPMEKAKPYLAF